MATTVHVKGISHQTSEKDVREFFSFCGKISSLSVTPESDDAEAPKSASVTFEKETAAKTALLLDNTMLGPAEVHVSSAASLDQISGSTSGSGSGSGAKGASSSEESSGDIAQEDKPRSRIFAEYLAHGYALSDQAIERAIHVDQQHGISNRFSTALQQFDSKYKASERVQAVDQKYGITARAQEGWRGFSSYFDKAAETPTGQRLRAFYEQGQKQVLDVHNEARHLADLKSGKGSGAQTASTSSTEKGHPTAEEAELEKVTIEGKERTKCNCGGKDGICACKTGECACSGCAKAGN